MRNFAPLIIEELKKRQPKAIPSQNMISILHVKKREVPFFKKDLARLIENGELLNTPKGILLPKKKPGVLGTVVRVNEGYGFVRAEGADSDTFVPGKYLKGAMPGDVVRMRVLGSSRGLPDGEVVEITERAKYKFSGTVKKAGRECVVIPDKDFKSPITLRKTDYSFVKDGDKITAYIHRYGNRHFDHVAAVYSIHGSALSAAACCEAILESKDIIRTFPAEVVAAAEEISQKGIHPKEIAVRRDLREENIFTIDSADSKDLDDAVSIEKNDLGWMLGVHIADVSYYVAHKSPLDNEALKRGTSVYFADSVVPMLPQALSNGICSLNEKEDRLTFSAMIQLNRKGELIGYNFEKTVIRSRVKGVYAEINKILDSTADSEIMAKYSDQLEKIALMDELANILNEARMARGGMNLDSTESKIITDENGIAVDIKERERGVSERIIEEFMLKANEAAALFGQRQELPFVFRVHESPDPDRIADLKKILEGIGVDTSPIKGEIDSAKLSKLLENVRESKYNKMVNKAVLRTMAKAKYSPQNIGHFGLVLKDYSHFTSPIRRYPDLMIHRFMSAKLMNMKRENIEKRFREFSALGSNQSTNREINAMQAERMCEDAYKAEYIFSHIGEEFEAVISGVASHGVYAELENTVEGMFKPADIEGYNFEYDDNMRYTDSTTKKTITVGDRVKIRVAAADVSSGEIDFALLEFLD